MTAKDFTLIATAMKSAVHGFEKVDNEYYRGMVRMHRLSCNSIADALTGTNPRFDRARFLAACGVDA